ncbi:multiprotein bridging factor aMBF1 [Methanobacterium alcaliphilum]|uniref:multiprotein bridging factor aMBF1 n=1 Tax=Methanobacterium alcaliphilum TaxID=392018 RepID=UPI00200ADE3C|nr:multiprotein bridging factor aMBF1 [Methanobacterium alcaliphilum]MCK9152123.1 multiprotein bridging factor aMBF1 [Methanobacterium alcaliphilum]
MRCEICGKKIMGQPIKTKIDGSVMNVCNDCSKFGKIQRQPTRPTKPRAIQRPPRREKPTYEVLEEYNNIVREAREKKGWSRENLAEKIYEKVSVINRIESGRMSPDIKLARKLERILNITILEKLEDTQSEEFKASSLKGATIGDIARIKKK